MVQYFAVAPSSQFGALSSTVTMDRLGSIASSTFYPYGEEYTTTAQDKEKFATYYRDGTTGLDYARNRYYSSIQGRFMTPDPYRNSAGPADPGSWNRYAYVNNDPVNYLDPPGLNSYAPIEWERCFETGGCAPYWSAPFFGHGGGGSGGLPPGDGGGGPPSPQKQKVKVSGSLTKAFRE